MKTRIVCLWLMILPAWCQHSDKPSPFDVKPVEEQSKSAPSTPVDPSGNTGLATFYRPKASEDDELTAVHLTLPVGSRVRVVNLDNNRSVVVRITGRAEFPAGRIISVDYRAAKDLDFLRAGTARVRLEKMEK